MAAGRPREGCHVEVTTWDFVNRHMTDFMDSKKFETRMTTTPKCHDALIDSYPFTVLLSQPFPFPHSMKKWKGDKGDASVSSSFSSPQQQQKQRLPLVLIILTLVTVAGFCRTVQDVRLSLSEAGTTVFQSSLQYFKQPPPQSNKTKKKKKKDATTTTTTTARTTTRVVDNNNDDDDPTWIDRQVEDPLPNPPMPNGTETFSACLLVMVRTVTPDGCCSIFPSGLSLAWRGHSKETRTNHKTFPRRTFSSSLHLIRLIVVPCFHAFFPF
jgi:hypothetical protein